jgi:hypothetical protein
VSLHAVTQAEQEFPGFLHHIAADVSLQGDAFWSLQVGVVFLRNLFELSGSQNAAVVGIFEQPAMQQQRNDGPPGNVIERRRVVLQVFEKRQRRLNMLMHLQAVIHRLEQLARAHERPGRPGRPGRPPAAVFRPASAKASRPPRPAR